MPRLEVEIGGNSAGLGQAVNQSLGILENLKNVANELKIDLFKATDVASLNAIGNTLTNVTGQITAYTNEAIRGSKAFQDQKTQAVLDQLNSKISVLNGNAQLFGNTITNQQSQLKAYQAAINGLLSNGLNPTDAKITSLKANVDALTRSIDAAKNPTQSLSQQYASTGRIIPDLETKIRRLREALSNATDIRGIAQYNNRIAAAQVELDRLRRVGIVTGDTLTNSANTAANAARRLSGGYNSVGLEFGRIIQDAPFAANNFGAIGNNITRLVEVIPGYVAQQRAIIIANGGIASSNAVLRASLASIFTGFGGVTIAISAIVAAFTFYQQYQQKVKRETDALKGANLSYIDTLHGINKAQLQGNISAQQDLTNLRLLYKAYQDATLPLAERRRAYQQIQELYPEYFKNISFEQSASGKTKKAYDELTGSILATSRARAAANIITKNSERDLENENKRVQARIKYEGLLAKRRSAQSFLDGIDQTSEMSGVTAKYRKKILEYDAGIAEYAKVIRETNIDSTKLNQQNLDLEKKVNAEIAKGGTLKDLNNNKDKKGREYRDTITPKVNKTTNDADLAGLIGNDVEIEKIRQKYVKLYDDINKEATKKGADLKNISALRAQAQINEATEISQAIIAEDKRVAEEIQRIRNESGIKSEENRAKELAQIQKWYDEQINKANGNALILAAIEEGKQAQRQAVIDKYEQKRIEAEDKLNKKIEDLATKGYRLNENNTVKGSRLIDEELQKRLKLIQEYFDKLRKMYANDPLAQMTLGVAQTAIENKTTADATSAKDGGLGKELTRAVNKFGTDFYRTLTNLNQQADQTFEGIFTTLAQSFSSSMNDIFLNVFQKKLTAAFDSATTKLGAGLTTALAGVGLLGGTISGVTKKSSIAGQGLGGALSGAAAGAVAGSAVPGLGTAAGAIIGGALGLLGGVFGAKKAKEQENLQKRQLVEAEKQTRLLERQNALAYTASIIGKMTTNGIVTGVEINEFGQLTTKISGNDLSIVLDRANRSRKRGV